jgi:protein-L-isoaspartate(D-aspartate) O-methyltransferase
MKKVDRKFYAPVGPYEDRPQYIGYGATISAPHMHGFALEALLPSLKPGNKVLDVGCGSGYLCSCFAHLVLDYKGFNIGWSIRDRYWNRSHP